MKRFSIFILSILLAGQAYACQGLCAAYAISNPGFVESTMLIELTQGTELSSLIHQFESGGFDTAYGSKVTFSKWYSSRWTDARAIFMTQVNKDFGVLWGFTTGERGEKYTIEPSLKLGFVYQKEVSKNSVIGFKALTTLGGQLHEHSCMADYGDIGGVQEVNCRLAATPLQPSETLKYLVNQKPLNRNQISLQFRTTF